MIISTDDIQYKSIIFIEENEMDPYLTQVATYNTPKFEVEDEYNLMYGIRLGSNVARMFKRIRMALEGNENDTVYELKDAEESSEVIHREVV